MPDPTPTKPCTKCGHDLPLDQYATDTAGRFGRRSQCRPCKAAMDRDYLMRARFGLTVETYDELLAAQGHRCALCRADKPGGRWPRFHVDHCHTTGRVRGLLCRSCNMALGILGDSPEGLLAAYRYVTGEEST